MGWERVKTSIDSLSTLSLPVAIGLNATIKNSKISNYSAVCDCMDGQIHRSFLKSLKDIEKIDTSYLP